MPKEFNFLSQLTGSFCQGAAGNPNCGYDRSRLSSSWTRLARGIPFLLRLPTVPLYSANQQFSFVNHFFGQALMQIEEKFFVPHHF